MLFEELLSTLFLVRLRLLSTILLLVTLAAPVAAAPSNPVGDLVKINVTANSADPVDPQNYFPFYQSNSWRFSGRNTGTKNGLSYDNTYANNMLITGTKLMDTVNTTVFFESNPGNIGQSDETYLVKNAAGITNYGSASYVGLASQLAPYLELRFPLVASDNFVQLDRTGMDLGLDLDGDGRNETFNARSVLTVADFEMVTVPAGTFTNCVKLVRQTDLSIILSSTGQLVSGTDIGTMWLAPNIGPVKRAETLSTAGNSDSITEVLSEYVVNGQGPGISNGPLAFVTQPANLVVRNGTLFWTDASAGAVKQSAKGGEVVPMTGRLGDPIGMAAGGQELFWVEERGGFAASGCAGQGVVRVLKQLAADGKTVIELASGDACSGGTADLVVDDTSVYWVNSVSTPNRYSISKVPRAGGPAITLVTTTKRIAGLAGDQDNLYWQEEGIGPITLPDGPEGSSVSRMDKAGGAPQLLVNGALNGLITQPPDGYSPGSWFPRGGLTVMAGDLFFSDTNFNGRYRLFKVPVTGGALVEQATLTTADASNYIRRLAAADGSVVWLDGNGVKTLPATGGVPQTLASTTMTPFDLLIAGGQAYWTETSGTAHGETGTLKAVPLVGGTVDILVQGGDAPRWLAVAGSQLYWSEGGPIGQIEGFTRLARILIGSRQPVTVLLGVGGGPMAADDSNLYVGSGFRIYKIPVDGGPPETLVHTDDKIYSLACDGSYVYWLEGPLAVVRRAPVGGGLIDTLFGSTVSPLSGPAGPIRVSGGYVYWMSHFSAISRVPAGGGPVQTIVSSDLSFLSDFVTDGASIYFSDQDTGDIKRVPVTGGNSVTLANGRSYSSISLALDSNYLYWIDQTLLGKVPLTGGPILLIAGVNNAASPPAAIAVDGASLYWTETASGAVMKMTKSYAPGDCNDDGSVTIAEVQSAINMFLGLKAAEACVDQDGTGGVSIAEIQKVINSFLGL